MPFTSKKQKRTIDAAAHNPEFAKKVGIKVADAKKMSAHGKGQKKFSKAEESMLNDFTDFIVSEDGPGQFGMNNFVAPKPPVRNNPLQKPPVNKGVKTLNQPDPDPADNPQNWKPITSKDEAEYARRLQWYRDNDPGAFDRFSGPNSYNDMVKWQRMKGEKDVVLPVPPSEPVYPAPKQQRSIKKSDASDFIDSPTQVALGGEEEMPRVAEAAKKGSAKKALKHIRAKSLKESISVIQQMIAEAKKKEMKCTECGMYESKCGCDHTNEGYTINGKKVTKKAYNAEMKKAGKKVKEGNDGNLANNAKPYDKVTRGDVIAGRLGKDEMGGKKKSKKTTEGNDGNLANNAKPYDKVTRGDVIAGRLGKDEMGGKKKKVKESYSREELARRIFEGEGHEGDHEASMAKAELLEIAKNAMQIFQIIKEGDNLDGWISNHISVANDHLNSVAEKMSYEDAKQDMKIPSDDEYIASLMESLENFKRQ